MRNSISVNKHSAVDRMRIVHFGRESLVFVVVVFLYLGVIAKRQAQPFAHQ
jgi:hypothetical protein